MPSPTLATSSTLTKIFSGHILAVAVLVYFSLLHCAALYLFTRGFLLSRLALPDIALSSAETTLLPTHARAIIIIIDALRFDFVSPDSPNPPSEFYHNVLTLPAELSAKDPSRSFLFHSYSDPPTTTLQRLKGITTGSLPTFIDIGSNFHSTSVTEDSIIRQVELSTRFQRRAFMGDDTWLSIYPNSFTTNLTHPFDSFNVEDLHTVDAGVSHQLVPLLSSQNSGTTESSEQPFQFIVAHFLGVDHVGHRLGPSHLAMQAKLAQMDTLLRQVVALLHEDTLLVMLGDHGMDPKGDHGGDSPLETSTTTWIYSSGPLLSSISGGLPSSLTPNATFPGASRSHRAIQQIDLVPTLSLLLGLPIPFNNLGSVIPELFWRPNGQLESALRVNAEQVWRFLTTYRASSSGSELDESWDGLQSAWGVVSSLNTSSSSFDHGERDGHIAKLDVYAEFNRRALSTCRSIWAQFDVSLIVLGLSTFLLSSGILGVAYWALAKYREGWEAIARRGVTMAAWGAVTGGIVGYLGGLGLRSCLHSVRGVSMVDWVIFGCAIGSAAFIVYVLLGWQNLGAPGSVSLSVPTILGFGVLIIHALSFTSNSFILWEDHLVPYQIFTLLLPVLLRAACSPTRHLQLRLLGFPLLVAACSRLMSVSTVCREEQHPNCHVTFYSSSTIPVSPVLVLLLSVPAAFFLPRAIRSFLSISKSDRGIAPLFLDVALRISLLAGTAYWLMERLESWDRLNPDRIPLLKMVRTVVARAHLGSIILVGYVLWYFSPPCVELQIRQAETGDATQVGESKKQVYVIGFANSYGSSYLLFVLVFFALFFAVTQLTGQIVLSLFIIALLALLETVDSTRDVRLLLLTSPRISSSPNLDAQMSLSSSPTFADPVMLALLGGLLFFTTGHQAVLSSIQWKTAFIGFPTLTYPFSPMLVVLNSFGSFVLAALCVPLIAMWNVSPIPKGKVNVLADTLKVAVGYMLYHAVLAMSCAACAAWLRRHLMVWKVFAPRFMLAGVTLLVVDVALVLAVGVGSSVTCGKIRKLFGTLT